MADSLTRGPDMCSFYNGETHRCTLDGSSWCAFPKSNYCDLAVKEVAKTEGIPTVIWELLHDALGNE